MQKYSSLSIAVPAGHLVNSLDLGELLKESRYALKVWSRLLECTPNVTSISVYAKQCRALSGHPVWQKIKRLRLQEEAYEDDDDDDIMETETSDGEDVFPSTQNFPPHLETLILYGNTSILGRKDWSKVSLPNLRSLVLDAAMNPDRWGGLGRKKSAVKRRILPQAPLLTRMKVDVLHPPTGGPPNSDALKLVEDAGPQLRHLEYKDQETADLLDPSLMVQLNRLEYLVYEGKVPRLDLETLKQLFPPALRYLELIWPGDLQFGSHLMQHLPDPTFLPNLIRCPELLLSLNPHPGTTRPTEAKLNSFLDRAIETHQKLLSQRPSLDMQHEFRIPLFSQNNVPYLPVPVAYCTCLPRSFCAMLDRAVASGHLVP